EKKDNDKNRHTLTIRKEGISYTINMVVNGEIDDTKVTIKTASYSDEKFSEISDDIEFLKELAADEANLKKMKVIQNEVSIDKNAIYVPYVATQVLHIIEELDKYNNEADVTDLAVINLPNAKLLDKAIARMRDNVTEKVGITPTKNKYNEPIIEAINKEYNEIFDKRGDEGYNGDTNKNNQKYKKKSPKGKYEQEGLQLKGKPNTHIKQNEIQLTIHSDKNGAQNRLLQIRKAATDQMLRDLMMDNIEKWVEICQEATEDTKTETQMSKLIQQLNKALPEAELEAIKANEAQIPQLLRNSSEYEKIRQRIRRQVLTNKGVQETLTKLITEIHTQMQEYNISEGITNCKTEPRWNTVREYIEAILVGIYGRGANLSDDELGQKTGDITSGSLLMVYGYDDKVKIWNAEDKPQAYAMEEDDESETPKEQQAHTETHENEFTIISDKMKEERELIPQKMNELKIEGQEKDELQVEYNDNIAIQEAEKPDNEIRNNYSLEIKREKAHKPDPNASLKIEQRDAIELSEEYNETHEHKPNKEDDMCEEVPLSLQQRIEKAEEQARTTGIKINEDLTSTELNNSDKTKIDKEIEKMTASDVPNAVEQTLSEYNEKVNNATENSQKSEIREIQKLHYKLIKLQERIGNEDKFK
ncbi:MAG: hypothetical protein IJS10_00660, partial [Alphaproteobacteria bacterium]|nr:hypothetical protein [Alphaproteobacteria bacterium]